MAVRVLLDARKVGDGGIGVYLDTLIRGLSAASADGRANLSLTLLIPSFKRLEEQGGAANARRRETLWRWQGLCECVEEPAGKYSAAEYFSLGRRQRALLQRIDLFHAPHYTLPFNLGVPSVVTIHDAIHLIAPHSAFKRPVARAMIASALKRAGGTITVSEYSRRTLTRFFPRAAEQIYVVPNGLSPAFGEPKSVFHARPARTLPEHLSEKFLLFVGNDRFHKGCDVLLEAWRLLQSTAALPGVQLIIVGSQFSPALRRKVLQGPDGGSVTFAGDTSDGRLRGLYSSAEALIVSSREEGFGLCALEAMALGTPVISTPLASVKEVCEDAAWYSSDCSAAELAAAILKRFNDLPAAREKIDCGLRRSAEFSAERQTLETCLVYSRVLEKSGSSARIIGATEAWLQEMRHTGS